MSQCRLHWEISQIWGEKKTDKQAKMGTYFSVNKQQFQKEEQKEAKGRAKIPK